MRWLMLLAIWSRTWIGWWCLVPPDHRAVLRVLVVLGLDGFGLMALVQGFHVRGGIRLANSLPDMSR